MFRFFLLGSCLLISFQSVAIVNIEKNNIDDKLEAVQGEFEFDLSGVTGNSDISSISLGGRVQWNDVSTRFFVLKYNHAKSLGVKSTDKTFLHYRYIDKIKQNITWESFFQVENDKFKYLTLRTLLGGGYRFKISSENKTTYLRSGLGIFYSNEELNDVATAVTDTDEVVRVNLYFTYQYKIKKNINFLSTTYYQPVLDDLSDYRALEQLSFEFNLSQELLYFMTIDFNFDSKPFSGLEKSDTSYKSGIKYRF